MMSSKASSHHHHVLLRRRTASLLLVGALSFYALWIEYGVSVRLTNDNNRSYETVIDIAATSATTTGRQLAPPPQAAGTTNDEPFSICTWAAKQNPMDMWASNIEAVLAASRMKLDLRYRLEDITAKILLLISDRLPKSVKTTSQDAETMNRIVQKLEARYKYLIGQHPTDGHNIPPPVKIAVLGGSVTAGVNCYTGRFKLHLDKCAWPARLQRFVNEMAKMGSGHDFRESLIEVTTVAVGGSNTATGRTVLEYDLMPETRPDILINAYSTNDMHVLTLNEATRSNITVREKVFGMAQDFVRTALDDCKKRDKPLLIWLDDYLGNEQREILATTELSQSIHVLANYYGFSFVSYADAVRDLVYGDTTETTFSPGGWYEEGKSGMLREIHPGQGMHQATAWVMAYNLFSLLSTHCSAEKFRKMNNSKNSLLLTKGRKRRRPRAIKLDEQIQLYTPVSPRQRPTGLPPVLTANLTLDVVSDQWQQAAGGASKQCATTTGTKCPFSWVSGVPYRDEEEIQEHFGTIVQTPTDWEIIDDNIRKLKYGWMPKAGIAKPKLVMEFNNAADYKSVTFFMLKSYGSKWKGSTATVAVERKINEKWAPVIDPFDLSGEHDKMTSETYTETVQLQHHNEPTPLRVTLTLTGGNTFKLMGIAVCQ